MASGNFLVFLRKLALLLVLVFVALGSYLSRLNATNWEDTVWVAVYPINGDGSEAAARYIETLTIAKFTDVESFVKTEAERYQLPLNKPMRVDLGQPVVEQPPIPPTTGSMIDIALWSLKFRYWSSQVTSEQTGPTPDIRIFVRYFDPESTTTLPHSVGLQKGLLGIVNGFADERLEGRNNVVLLHEVLHTLGATDKYDATNQPVFPHGYAEPDRVPLHPQRFAELMGGRIAISASEAEMPSSLSFSRIGALSAQEINWLSP